MTAAGNDRDARAPTAAISSRTRTDAHGLDYRRIYTETPDGRRRLTILNLPALASASLDDEAQTVAVHGAPARGIPLLTNGHLGADLLYLAPGDSFPLHVHPGHHLLLCVAGSGKVTFDGRAFEVRPGDLYLIEASVPHAVGSSADGPGHWLASFGAPHTPLTSEQRMRVVSASADDV